MGHKIYKRYIRTALFLKISVLSAALCAAEVSCIDFGSKELVEIDRLLTANQVRSPADRLRVQIAESRRMSGVESIDQLPVSFDSSFKPFNQVVDDIDNVERLDSSLSASYDLKEAVFGYDEKVRKFTAQSLSISSKQVENQARYTALSETVSALASQSLISIFNRREAVLLRKLEYFEIKKNMGEQVSKAILDAESDLIEIRTKRRASQLRLSSSLSKLNLKESFLAGLPSIFELTSFPDIACGVETSLSVQASSASVQLSQAENDRVSEAKLFDVRAFVNAVSEYDRSAKETTDKLTYGLEITVPLWSGARSAEVQDAEAKLLESQLEKERTLVVAGESLEAWRSSKEVLSLAIQASLNKLKRLNTEIDRIKERKNLGDSVFEEYSDLLIQASLLQESIVGSKLDLLKQFSQTAADFAKGSSSA